MQWKMDLEAFFLQLKHLVIQQNVLKFLPQTKMCHVFGALTSVDWTETLLKIFLR